MTTPTEAPLKHRRDPLDPIGMTRTLATRADAPSTPAPTTPGRRAPSPWRRASWAIWRAALLIGLGLGHAACQPPASAVIIAPPQPKPDPDAKSSNRQRPAPEAPTAAQHDNPVLWQTPIGLTTYRSTIHFYRGAVIVNSNGDSRSGTQDARDGVFVLDPATGRVLRQLIPPGQGELDTNGVALAGDVAFFGTDQGAIHAVDLRGQPLWSRDTPGDVEAAPVLADFNGDGVVDVAVGVEENDFLILDGRDGATLRTLKTGTGHYGQTGYDATAAAGDVNGDGVPDLFIPGRDNNMQALDGATGRPMWKARHDSGLRSSPILVDTDKDGDLELIYAEAYSDVYVVDARTGTIAWKWTLENPRGGIEGLFAPMGWNPEGGCLLIGTAWWEHDEGLYCVGRDGVRWRHFVPRQNVSSGTVLGDVDGKPGAEIVFGTEDGRVIALDILGNEVWSFQTDGPVECTPTLADLDGDGLLEVLVASNDGLLRALRTQGRAPALLGYHRGDATNAGLLFRP